MFNKKMSQSLIKSLVYIFMYSLSKKSSTRITNKLTSIRVLKKNRATTLHTQMLSQVKINNENFCYKCTNRQTALILIMIICI